MMTRKHFEAIAQTINEKVQLADDNAPDFLNGSAFDRGHVAGYLNALTEVAESLADMFVQENPRFDRDKFLTACGL